MGIPTPFRSRYQHGFDDAAVRNAKGREKPQKLSDGGGLHLLVNPDGARYWRMAYRYRGRQKTLAFGVYPIVSLAEARTAPDPQSEWLPPGAPQKEADQPPGGFTVSGLPPPGIASSDLALDCAPHDVAWNDERRLWYCDIGLDPGAAYYPFIRLALARYQPTSIAGAHLSNIVLADFVALTPARWLAVATTADPRSRQVTVSGHTFRGSGGALEAGSTPGSVSVAKTSVVEVWVEQLDPRLGNDFGWQRLATATVTSNPASSPGADPAEVLWSGQVTVPEITNGLGPYRLVVAEYEEYIVDDDTPYQTPFTRKDRRMVFVEHHVLDL